MVVVAIAIILLAALAVVWHMVSIQQGTATRGTVVRLETILPLQSLKIIVVAWQIVTQVSLCKTRYGIYGKYKFAPHRRVIMLLVCMFRVSHAVLAAAKLLRSK